MSHPQPRQQGGSNDMRLLQQQLLYKQLQELQRQQRLPQFNQVPRQHSSVNQLSTGAKPAAVDQLPTFLNGMPIDNASNCMRLDEFVGGESKPSIRPQMFAGNMNWGQPNESSAMYGFSNGLILPNEQDQAIRSMGSIAQCQFEQSLYGTPVSTSSASLDQYVQFQRIPNSSSDVIQMSSGNRSASKRDYAVFTEQDPAEGGTIVAKQGIQGNNLFMNTPNQDQVSGVMAEHIPQVIQSQSLQVQKIQNMQQQTDWSGSLQEKAVLQAGVSGGMPSLDPTEEKLLFGTDNDANWLASFGGGGNSSTGVHLHSNTLGDNDSFGGSYPSIHSGSWSALMLDALDATSSDAGVQEEWSGPSFHKTQHSTRRSSAPNDNGNQHRVNDRNMQNAFSSSSRPVHHFNETEARPSSYAAPAFQPFTRFSHEPNGQVPNNAMEGSSQQSSREAEIKHLDHQAQFVDGGFKIPMQSGISSVGAWGENMYEQSSCAPGVDLNPPSMTGVWVHQQNLPSSNVNSSIPNHKQDIWRTNGTMASGTNDIFAFHAGHDRQLHAQKGDMNGTMNTVRDHDGRMQSSGSNKISSTVGLETSESHTGVPTNRSQPSYLSSFTAASMNSNSLERNQEMNQQLNFRSNVSADHYAKARGDEIAEKIQHQPDSGPQDWDSSIKSSTKGVCGVQEPGLPKRPPNEGCSTHPSNSGQLADSGSLARENLFFPGSGPDHFIRGNQKDIGQTVQKAMGPHRFQYHPIGSLEMNMEPADGPNQTSYSQSLAQFQGLKNLNQGHVGRLQFVSQSVSNNAFMGRGQAPDSERNSKAPEETQSTSSISNSNPIKSASFDRTSGLGPQNKRMGQPSQNMLELLQKVDQSRDKNNTQLDFPYSGRQPEITKAAACDGPAFHPQYNQSMTLQGFGLRLGLSSQRQSVANHVLPSQTSSHDPTASSYSLFHADEKSQREYSDNNSSISGQPDKGTPNSRTYLNSSSGQQQEQGKQNPSSGIEHEAVDQSVDVSSDVDPQDKRASVDGTYNGNVTDAHQLDASQFQTLNRSHSQSMNAGFSILSCGQHVPQMKSALQPSTSGISKQAGHATLLNNVWKSVSAQNLSTVQPQKLTPNILQNIIPFPSSKDMNSWTSQKVDDQSNKYVNAPLGSIVCSTNLQQSISEVEVKINAMPQVPSVRTNVAPRLDGAHCGQDPAARHLSGGVSAVSSLSHLTQQDFRKGIHMHTLSHNSQAHTPFQKVGSSSHDIGIHEQPKSSDDVSQHSYSLLQQMQAMKGVDFDQGKRIGKKNKGTDSDSDASQINRKAAQMFTFGQNTFLSVPANRELNRELGINSNNPVSTDVKMLSFSSKESDDKSPSTSSHAFSRESGRHDLRSHPVTMVSKSGFMGGNERSSISPEMAPSWFEQYGNYKSGHILSMDERLKAAKAANQHLFLAKLSENRDTIPMIEPIHDTSNMASLGQGSSLNMVDANEVASPQCQEHSVLRPKKRKIAALPWHEEVSQRPRRQLSISTAELDWAQASKRMIEKVDNELAEDGPTLPWPRRRIILTTQLMQLLLPSIPASILTAEANSSYESVTYDVSRSALGGACSSISSSGNDSCLGAERRNMMSGILKTSDKDREQVFAKVVENTINRSRKMESDFSRLDKRTSILDIRVECQEFERFSIINRLGKYHGRSQVDGVNNLSTLESVPHKIYPQRLVTALSLTGNLPQGVFCLSL